MSKAIFRKIFRRGTDYNGETTYIMYHGTTMKAAQKIKRDGFICSADGMLGPGVYVSRSFKKAACYPKGAKGQKRAVLKLSVCVGTVKKIDRQGHRLQKSWHQAGYDTAWVPPNCGMVKSGLQENCVWDPKRIRVLSIQKNKRESSDDESTDEDDDDTNDSSDTYTDDSSSEHDDDVSSGHSDDDEASDEEGSTYDESSDALTDTDASESSVESSDEDSYESDDDY